MKNLLLCLLLLPFIGHAQTIDYEWLNQPCASLLSCDTGCTACNMPVNSGTQFIGNNVGWLGVDICPHPVIVGDNALFTYGWPALPDTQHAVIVTGLAFSPVRIDSIIIRHRSEPDGPQRLLVKYGVDVSMPDSVIADVQTPTTFSTTVLTNLGTVQATPQMIYGFFEILIQPYQGNGGAWDLDALRIVASPVSAEGVPEFQQRLADTKAPRFDLLGRSAGNSVSDGFTIDRYRRVYVH